MDIVQHHPKAKSHLFTHTKTIALTILAVVFGCFFVTTPVDAALLYVTPSIATINKDSTFTVSVRTDTQGQRINVAEATVSFPSDKLAIVKATPGSTFSIESPGSPKITKNQVFFSGGIPTPGYVGKSGVLGTITFRAISPGTAVITIDSGKILLNDGQATEAALQKSGMTVVVKEVPATVSKPTIPVAQETPTIIEELLPPVIAPVPPAPVQQQPSDIVTTITIRVKDLSHIVYALLILLGIFIATTIYLFFANIKLKLKLKPKPKNKEISNS